ncbi:hypothetical protein BC831DRAFT_135047 [Entophlyctis helioformis]|nr:hypothetical protein BC831DRAFT_135047 [Entophlyctis helioformis]
MCCSVDRIQDAIAPSAMWPDTPASTRVLLTNLAWISVAECAARRVCCHCLVWHPSRHANPAAQQAVPAANSKDRSIEHVSVAAHRCCCIPCRSRKAPGSSVLRCQCSRCPLEQQPDRPAHGRLPTSLAVWSHQTCTQSVPRQHRHGRQTAVLSSLMGNGACLDRQRVNAPARLSAACLLSARLVQCAFWTATTTLLCCMTCWTACCMPP